MIKKLCSMIDSIADRLEKECLFKEAEDLDIISNTIEAVDVHPMDYADKFDHIQENDSGVVVGDRGGRRFMTEEDPPPQLQKMFKKAPDGNWYLVGDKNVDSVVERPGNKFYLSVKNLVPVPGLKVAE